MEEKSGLLINYKSKLSFQLAVLETDLSGIKRLISQMSQVELCQLLCV